MSKFKSKSWEPQANASSLKLKSNGTVYILTEETSFSCTKRNQTEWPLKWKFSMRAEQLHTSFGTGRKQQWKKLNTILLPKVGDNWIICFFFWRHYRQLFTNVFVCWCYKSVVAETLCEMSWEPGKYWNVTRCGRKNHRLVNKSSCVATSDFSPRPDRYPSCIVPKKRCFLLESPVERFISLKMFFFGGIPLFFYSDRMTTRAVLESLGTNILFFVENGPASFK